jgi:probable rRNA maturation factor
MRVGGMSAVAVSGDVDGVAHGVHATAWHVLRQERRSARLAITFVGPARMRRLNADYLGHDYATDVISFPLPQPDGPVSGDIYICRFIAARNARAHGVPVRQELFRLVVHGTLHVLGWDHPDGAARIRSPMWQRQERYLASGA